LVSETASEVNQHMVGQTQLDHDARQAALDWLRGRINFERTLLAPYHERQLKLDRMRTLLVRLGRPDAGLKIVHVAGTKGKGSTAAMIAAILTAAGYRTGVFSSPHLERIEERFAVDGKPCTAAELVTLVDRLRPIVAGMDAEAAADGDSQAGPTYFEITTALALVHFVERQVDAAVLEVGLGGRLDATNVCLPVVSVITSISYDHTQQLGHTLAAIAGEKAGIIKAGVPVICGVTNHQPRAVIARMAQEHGCRLIQSGRDFRYRYRAGHVDFEYAVTGQEHRVEHAALGMRGPHQAANAAVALATIAELRHQGWCVSQDAARQGLELAKLPGRVELFAGVPNVVLDTAHNPASAQALVEALAELVPASRRTLILAASCDKDVAAIARELVPHFARIVVTQYLENPRAVPVAELFNVVRSKCEAGEPPKIERFATPREAWDAACRGAAPDDLVCIAGSFYLAAELRALVVAARTSSASSASSKLDR
jgi:dihydrofolate synthase / folylpolyglutamate synthase